MADSPHQPAVTMRTLADLLLTGIGPLEHEDVHVVALDALGRGNGERVDPGRRWPGPLPTQQAPADTDPAIDSTRLVALISGHPPLTHAILDCWQVIRRLGAENTDLDGLRAPGAQLAGAYLRGASLRHAVLDGADLRSCDLAGVDLTGASLTGARLCQANLRGADLTHTDLRRVDLSEADLRHATLTGASLRGAELWAAFTAGVDLTATHTDGCDLNRTDHRTIL